jgi:hypothetical protein
VKTSPSKSTSARRSELAVRVAEVLLGLSSVVFSVIILANPLVSLGALEQLLAFALGFTALRAVISGGVRIPLLGRSFHGLPDLWRLVQSIGLAGLGLIVLLLVGIVIVSPQLRLDTVVFVLTAGLIVYGFARLLHAVGSDLPRGLKGSSVAMAGITILAVVLALSAPGFAVLSLAIVLAVLLLLNGIESVVIGLRPTDPRQLVLLKLVLFSALYGLVLINWIDLFGKSVPAYGVWLILTYMAPFGVLLVFQGFEAWPLAASLGLLVSLMNDVGYYFIGNLIFGFHQPLEPWILGQLGFYGGTVVTVFYGFSFSLPITSWMMGLSIYLRILVVASILYYWWEHPAWMPVGQGVGESRRSSEEIEARRRSGEGRSTTRTSGRASRPDSR